MSIRIIRAILQHYLNPLHIYCRLMNLGLAKDLAIFLCRFYERAITLDAD
ncbi:MAG: hypothetical protein L6406_13485 [Desulfobacterales bacterium]|nr:hypothetical protein [Desulfobacterales bacterium]